MKKSIIALTWLWFATFPLLAHPADNRKIEFPNSSDGMLVLSVDPHTHTVFSDGHVWPSARVWESDRDGLDAWIVTEHLEYQPHRVDIPHPDRNRSYVIASKFAQDEQATAIVIAGAEITRNFPPGHVNAVFIDNANLLLVDNPRAAIESAKAQGGITIWNHGWWPRDFPSGVPKLHPMQRDLIADGLLDGIEVANGQYVSDNAFQIALDHGLAIIGASDIHGLIDYDYDLHTGQHRTVTLVLARDRTAEAIKEAFVKRRTAALYRHTILGREEVVRPIVEGALSVERGEYAPAGSTILKVVIRNAASSPWILRSTGQRAFNNQGTVITIPPKDKLVVEVTDVEIPQNLRLTFEVLNAFTAPGRNLAIEF